MNSNTLTPSRDGGKDGTTGYSIANPGVNSLVARDVYGYTLGYYQGDYKSIATTGFEAAVFGTANALSNDISPLYNGNIAYSTIAIEGFENQASSYRYDQLQRLKSMKVFRSTTLVANNNWFGSAATPEYGSTYSYDENGNLAHLVRKGTTAGGLNMDDMEYVYHAGNWNRLAKVTDAGLTVSGYDDIKTMTSSNYSYDKLGQLKQDLQENITLDWRFGDKKLKTTVSSLPNKEDLAFVYNPMGQRILKIVKPKVAGNVQPESAWKYYYYAYDANGQVMATYEVAYSTYNTAKLNEQMLYGQGRLGYRDRDQLIYTSQFALPAQGDIYNNTLGEKRYEMTNHLGNVVAVLSDRKMATTGGTPSTYQAVIWMKSDYYPFGMQMPAKSDSNGITINGSWHTDEYRFGYNGMEKDPEVKGDGNSYTTEFRQYDPRLGRWMSLDPLMMQFPWMSPYVAFDNNPVVYTDPYGLEATGGGNPAIFNTGEESEGTEAKNTESGTPVGTFPQWDEELEYYAFNTESRKWRNTCGQNFRLEKDPMFKKEMNKIGDRAVEISKKMRLTKGYSTHFSKDDVIAQIDFESVSNEKDDQNVFSQMYILRMRYKTAKGTWLNVNITIATFSKGTTQKVIVDGKTVDEVTPNQLVLTDVWQIESIYTNCFAGALGLIGHV